MDFYRQAGPMVLGSRLRSLASDLTRQAALVYDLYGVALDPRWFPVFYVLSEDGPRPVTEIARIIGHSHASVSQIVKAMTRRGLVTTSRSDLDGRVRIVRLTADGTGAAERIQDQYADVTAAVHGILGQMQHDLWSALDEIEAQLGERSLFDRVRRCFQEREGRRVEIVDFSADDSADFERLNREWIEHYFQIEEADLRYLRDPVGQILEPGGHIHLARYEGEVIGTCALIHKDEDTLELAKMAVTKAARGKGVGRRLGLAALAKARELGARRVYLESSTKLQPAVQLYRQLGFRDVEGPPSPYERCNVQMELLLAD